MKQLCQFAADISDAAGGSSISRGAAAIVSGRILACLDKISDDAAPENLAKFASAAAKLLSGEQNSVRLKFAHECLRQRERQILLMRDKHQRDSVTIAIRVLNDDRAKAIARTKCNHTEKIELMGHQPLPANARNPASVPPLKHIKVSQTCSNLFQGAGKACSNLKKNKKYLWTPPDCPRLPTAATPS